MDTIGRLCVLVLTGLMAAPAQAMDDRAIEEEIRSRLARDLVLGRSRIVPRATGGRVQLVGRVPNLLARERAERLGENLLGVRAIDNRLEVAVDRAATDAQLTAELNARLARDPILHGMTQEGGTPTSLTARVERGHARLDGLVPSLRMKAHASQVTAGLTGVRSFENALRVVPREAVPAEMLQHRVARSLSRDPGVGSPVQVVVMNDGVHLAGTVRSVTERRRAIEAASIAGVSNVDATALDIDPGHQRQPRVLAAAPGASVVGSVREALDEEPRLGGSEIDVALESDRLVLRGFVPTLSSQRLAERTAREIDGVLTVESKLAVQKKRARPEWLIGRIRQELDEDSFLADADLSLQVEKGRVRLTGTVDSTFERNRAEELVAAVPGVLGLENGLIVDGPAMETTGMRAFAPAASSGPSDDDAALRRRIEEGFRWSPFVDHEKVRVEVTGGTVTLSGSVEGPFARENVLNTVTEAGATKVIDDLH